MQQFFGFVSYYRNFINNRTKIAKALTSLLRKVVSFRWCTPQEAFRQLKRMLCTYPILQYPDSKKPFIRTTDASERALGAAPSQGIFGKNLPNAYASRSITDADINYTTVEKGILAVIFAVEFFKIWSLFDHRY